MSFGVFDKEYVFKRPESAATGGALYWDDKNLDVDSKLLLEQMDFPLCSVALAYDGINALDPEKMKPIIGALPLFLDVYQALEEGDKRDPEAWKAKAPKEVLMRNATSTRADYEGEKLMKKQAHWLMKQAALTGFRGIQIECVHDAVHHVWMNPPEPYTAELISEMDTGTYMKPDSEGNMVKAFGEEAKQVISKVYVTLVSSFC